MLSGHRSEGWDEPQSHGGQGWHSHFPPIPARSPVTLPGLTCLKPQECSTIFLPWAQGWVWKKKKIKDPTTQKTQRCHLPYLDRFAESDTKVSKYLKAFIQFHGFFVFAEKVYQGVGLVLELLLAAFQLGQLLQGELRESKQAHTEVSSPAGVLLGSASGL